MQQLKQAPRPLAHISWERWASGPAPIPRLMKALARNSAMLCRVPWIYPSRGINDSPSHDDSQERLAPNSQVKGEFMLCDREGVPLLIQSLRYCYSHASFEAVFFNGKRKMLTVDYIGVDVDLLDDSPSRMKMLEAENRITILAGLDWSTWFPLAS